MCSLRWLHGFIIISPSVLTAVANINNARCRHSTFKRGWTNTWKGQLQKGYYIGRPHPPYTEVKVVKAIVPEHAEYMVECAEGEPGLLLVKGANLMSEYIKKPEATAKAITQDGWYVNLGDMAFWRANPADSEADATSSGNASAGAESGGGGSGGGGAGTVVRDYFWQSRDSALLIKGGSNYAYVEMHTRSTSMMLHIRSTCLRTPGDGSYIPIRAMLTRMLTHGLHRW